MVLPVTVFFTVIQNFRESCLKIETKQKLVFSEDKLIFQLTIPDLLSKLLIWHVI